MPNVADKHIFAVAGEVPKQKTAVLSQDESISSGLPARMIEGTIVGNFKNSVELDESGFFLSIPASELDETELATAVKRGLFQLPVGGEPKGGVYPKVPDDLDTSDPGLTLRAFVTSPDVTQETIDRVTGEWAEGLRAVLGDGDEAMEDGEEIAEGAEDASQEENQEEASAAAEDTEDQPTQDEDEEETEEEHAPKLDITPFDPTRADWQAIDYALFTLADGRAHKKKYKDSKISSAYVVLIDKRTQEEQQSDKPRNEFSISLVVQFMQTPKRMDPIRTLRYTAYAAGFCINNFLLRPNSILSRIESDPDVPLTEDE